MDFLRFVMVSILTAITKNRGNIKATTKRTIPLFLLKKAKKNLVYMPPVFTTFDPFEVCQRNIESFGDDFLFRFSRFEAFFGHNSKNGPQI